MWHYFTIPQYWEVGTVFDGEPLGELRKRLTRKYLKAITKIYNTNLAEDHGKVVPNCVASAALLLQRSALPIQMKEKPHHILKCF